MSRAHAAAARNTNIAAAGNGLKKIGAIHELPLLASRKRMGNIPPLLLLALALFPIGHLKIRGDIDSAADSGSRNPSLPEQPPNDLSRNTKLLCPLLQRDL